jgi:hypothetical protein
VSRPRGGPGNARLIVLGLLAASLACREPPAREMRRIEGANVEIRAIGLARPPEAALNAAFASVSRIDGGSVDRAVAVLRQAGSTKGLVNLGGDHLAVFGEPLVVAVPDPTDVTRPRWASFTLSESALARATASADGPGTLSVTVVAGSGREADAIAAEALPLAPGEAVARLSARGASGFVLTRDAAARRILATPGFAAAHDLRGEAGVEVRP